jgi:hypothetical protein
MRSKRWHTLKAMFAGADNIVFRYLDVIRATTKEMGDEYSCVARDTSLMLECTPVLLSLSVQLAYGPTTLRVVVSKYWKPASFPHNFLLRAHITAVDIHTMVAFIMPLHRFPFVAVLCRQSEGELGRIGTNSIGFLWHGSDKAANMHGAKLVMTSRLWFLSWFW